MNGLLKLNTACRFYPYDGIDRQEYIIRTPNNRQFRISPLAKTILERFDGRTSLEELSASLESQSVYLTVEELRGVIDKEYKKMDIFEQACPEAAGKHPEHSAGKKALPLLLHWDLVLERVVAAVSTRLKFLYSPPAVISSVLLILISHYLVYFEYAGSRSVSNANFLLVLLLSLLSVLCHEFGHSSAVSRYGGTPGRIGFGLYILLPTFYADVSDIWRFRRNHRIVVDLGGVYFQQITFAALAIVGILTGSIECLIVCRFIDVMVFLTLNPVFKFDGYWFLADYLRLPNLHQLAWRYIGNIIKKAFRRAAAPFSLPPLPRHAYAIFIIYALLSNVFIAAILLLSFNYLYNTFARFPALFLWLWQSMAFALKTQDLFLFLNRIVALFLAIAFPLTVLIGLYKYAIRIGKYFIERIQSPRLLQRGLSSNL